MVARLLLITFTSSCLFAQCDDVAVPAKQARRYSDVVFQGTVEGFKGSGVDRTVIFRVTRVWKGRVGPTFEMLAVETAGGLCPAFWKGLLAPGNELVVYASRPFLAEGVKDLLPIRSKSTLASQAKDISALGHSHKPK